MVARYRPPVISPDPRIRIICADVLVGLSRLPAKSVHLVVTSPPYWGLRNYGEDGQIGLEKSPEGYVGRLVEVFRGVHRVLRDDGVVYLNLGDSYNGKEIAGIPWRVAFALQADGWYLRQDIIWSKPNPMPESVTDRCTKAHEYIFLLTKSDRYCYDAVAIAEDVSATTILDREEAVAKAFREQNKQREMGRSLRRSTLGSSVTDKRNKRSVWHVASQSYAEAHFATFPPALIEPCIKAGTSARGCCPDCGAPWERAVRRKAMKIRRSDRTHEFGRSRSSGTQEEPAEVDTEGWYPSCRCGGNPTLPDYPKEPKDNAPASVQRNYRFRSLRVAEARKALIASVEDVPVVPAVVLDPFGGAGTTGLVSNRFNRSAVLLDLNPKYCTLAAKRIRDDSPFMADRVEYVEGNGTAS
jgi:DNA modification methylase